MDDSTERFLQLMEKQNVAIAAAEAEKERQRNVIGTDPIREQREQERREKWGQLRAREHPNLRPHRTRNVFPHIDLSS